MRIARMIMLLALMAMAAMALAASSASATSEVSFEDESLGGGCNPCSFHVIGESSLARLDTGAVVYRCNDEFDIDLYEAGTGEVEWSGVTDIAPGCNSRNCVDMVGASHWQIEGSEETGAGEVEHDIDICFRNPLTGLETECEVMVYAEEVDFHTYIYHASDICGGTIVTLDATGEGPAGYETHHP